MVIFFRRIYFAMMVLVVTEENVSAELDADRHRLEPSSGSYGDRFPD